MEEIDISGAVCPMPINTRENIVMGHGSGGKMSAELIEKTFLRVFNNPALNSGDDGAVVNLGSGRIVISTDSHVVTPLFFPGGDIGHLAICGTVNDVAMMGATPKYISAGFILEEGLSIELLNQIILSMQHAASEAGVQIVCGDTKVVQKGRADGLYITTTGVGVLESNIEISGSKAKTGDVVILSGTIGDHGIAVLSARNELGFEAEIQSDSAPLNHLVTDMLKVSQNIHVLRDPTRGGLATTLNEIAKQSNVGIALIEKEIPVKQAVASVCEILGFDPLYIANEGKLIAIVSKEDSENVLKAMRSSKYGIDAVIIGEVVSSHPGKVIMKTLMGTNRVVDVLMGEMLPRIC